MDTEKSQTDLKSALPFGFGVRVHCVPAGTVVGQDDYGNDMTVTDSSVVNKGPNWWVTEKIFEDIKARTKKRLS